MRHRIFLRSEQRVFLLFPVWFLFLFFCLKIPYYGFGNGRTTAIIGAILWQNVGVCGTQNLKTVETNQLVKMHYRKLRRS
jgi:hypothetical protein